MGKDFGKDDDIVLNEKILSFLSRWVGYAIIGLLFGLASFLANLEIKDLDLWLHIGAGRYILQNGYIPLYDIFSNSIAGQPWDNHEWLFQIGVAAIFDAFGSGGLQTMQAILVALTLGLLLMIGYHRDRQLLPLIALLVVMMVYQSRFTIRPDLFSLAFFIAFMLILSTSLHRKWAPWGLGLIQLLWVNMHGFFFFGPLFVLIGISSEIIKRHIPLPWEWNTAGRLDDSQYRNLKKAFVFVILACLVNPGFWRGAIYPLAIFWNLSGEHQIFFKHIQELQKPLTWGSLWNIDDLMAYKALIFISATTFILNRRLVDLRVVLLWGIFLVFSLNALRNMSFFAVAAYLVISENFRNLDFNRWMPARFHDQRFKHGASLFLKLIIILWLLNYAQDVTKLGYYDFERYERKSEYGGIAQRSYPDKAVDFLVENEISGNFLNDFNSGAYLIGRAYPRIKVFIDGRTEVYGADFFRTYLKIFSKFDKDVFEKVVAAYKLTGILLNTSTNPTKRELLRYVYFHPDWKLVYFDYDGLVFLKDVPANQRWIAAHQIELARWQVQELDIYRLGSTQVVPYRNYFRAYTLESLDLNTAARAEAMAALKVYPAYAEPYEVLGKVEANAENFEKAYQYFRQAVVLNLTRKSARMNMAKALMDLEKYSEAIAQYEKISQIWPEDPKSRGLMAKALVLDKQPERAIQEWTRATELSAPGAKDMENLLDAYISVQLWEHAKIFLEDHLADQRPKSPDFMEKEAQVYQQLNIPYPRALQKSSEETTMIDQ